MIGIDEVGRGAIAGPLLVCAVRLRKSIPGLKDSKLISAKKRKQFSDKIKANAEIGYGWVDAASIDDIGLIEALKLASSNAVQELDVIDNEEIIIDGTINFLPDLNCKCIPKADNLFAEVSAASIVAKVARDEYMKSLALRFPGYGFDSHVGYGTKTHLQAINELGYCQYHRKSFNIQKHLSG